MGLYLESLIFGSIFGIGTDSALTNVLRNMSEPRARVGAPARRRGRARVGAGARRCGCGCAYARACVRVGVGAGAVALAEAQVGASEWARLLTAAHLEPHLNPAGVVSAV